jgi:UDP-N-acetylmuramoyl-L-alanyl-D-glutamate--2,6-diaminopimelate ligase
VLQTIVETKPEGAALWCVFGCGGDRDKEKRPIMGSVAEKYADRVLVTSDNPRTEDPQSIIDDIRRGLAVDARCIVDRREAIWEAVSGSSAGDIILVAGKGHETYQIIGTEKLPFDDRAVVREAFQSEASSH